MGIPTYFSYIVKNHSDIINVYNSNTMQINNFYLDCNSIIYDCVHNINFTNLIDSDTNTIIKAVCCKIKEYIDILKPNNIIFIAFDGVAPVAKLEQQRSRRYKSLYQNNIFKDPKLESWNTTAITPGTVFMNDLNSYIKKEFNNPINYNVKQIILSTSDNPGEGEHKIFEFIRNFPELNNNFNIIYGLDADLIMLALNHLPICNNIYLYRETPNYIKSINVELEPNKSYIINIPELARIITLNMNNQIIYNNIKSSNTNLELSQQHNRIYDYIFLCFFLGNDFMPHFPAVNIATGGINKLLNAYKATIGGTNEILTDGKIIYWKNVKKIIVWISLNEEEFLITETKLREKKSKYILPNNTPEEQYKKFDAIPMYDRIIEKYINPHKTGWQERYYYKLFDMEIDIVRKEQICMNYLEGLEWTMKYYTIGCPDWRWSYKYHYPPLFVDLVQFIPNFEKEFIKTQPARPVNQLVQLSYVLPKQSLYLLPTNLHNALLKEHDIWYKMNCKFIWSYCRYFWESHVDLPDIDIDELENFVNKM